MRAGPRGGPGGPGGVSSNWARPRVLLTTPGPPGTKVKGFSGRDAFPPVPPPQALRKGCQTSTLLARGGLAVSPSRGSVTSWRRRAGRSDSQRRPGLGRPGVARSLSSSEIRRQPEPRSSAEVGGSDPGRRPEPVGEGRERNRKRKGAGSSGESYKQKEDSFSPPCTGSGCT